MASLLVGPGSAGAAASTSPTLVSVPDPFAPTDCGLYPADTQIRPRNEPHEPVDAVNPANPSNVVVAYIVDGFVSNLVRTSFDGGRTWTTSEPGTCGSPTNGTASDPSLAFSSDGRILYLVGLALGTSPNVDTVVVNRSLDGGLTWSPTSVLSDPDGLKTDMETVTTDPTKPLTAFVTFERHDQEGGPANQGASSAVYVRRTDDGGATWSAASVVYRVSNGQTPAGQVVTATRVSVLPDGTLVDVFERQNADPQPGLEDNVDLASRSADGGATWSPPVAFTQRTSGQGTDGGPYCALWSNLQSTIAPDGTLYAVATQDARNSTDPMNDPRLDTNLVVYLSRDGVTWSRTGAIAAPTTIGMPAIAASPDGSVGMTYFQLENSTCTTPAPAEVWYARSTDHGSHWMATKLTGSFDAMGDCTAAATPIGGCAIADYDGLVPAGKHGFAAAFEMTKPYAVNGPSDIFFDETAR